MAGRVPKLNKVLISKMCKQIEKGMTRKLTCAYVGINECTFYGWLNDATMINNALEKGKDLVEPMIIDIADKTFTITNCSLKIELIECIKRSEAKYLAKCLDVLDGAIVDGKDVSTAKWLLERRCRKEFSSQATVNVGNADGQPFKQEVHNKSMLEQFAEFEKLLEGAKLGDVKPPEDTDLPVKGKDYDTIDDE